jgi:acyl-CoA reductase-like NAD-dependent aldehyde dehydrogenase
MVANFVNALEARAEEIARSISTEMGKLLAEAGGEAMKAVVEARAAGCTGQCAHRRGFWLADCRDCQLFNPASKRCDPWDNPWNFPSSPPMRKAIPALVYGNAIILKPACLTPGAVVLMAEVAADTLSENMVQAVIGRGALGQALAEHSGVDAVGFTGSVAVGKRVAIAAAGHLVEVSLELGAKNPAVLNDASDLDRALDQILLATFAACGQRCTAVS